MSELLRDGYPQEESDSASEADKRIREILSAMRKKKRMDRESNDAVAVALDDSREPVSVEVFLAGIDKVIAGGIDDAKRMEAGAPVERKKQETDKVENEPKTEKVDDDDDWWRGGRVDNG